MLDLSNTASCIFALLVCGVLLLVSFKQRTWKNDAGKRYPPRMPALPIVGSLPFLKSGMVKLPEMFLRQADKLGSVYFFYAGRNLAVSINRHEAIVNALVKHSEAFAARPENWAEVHLVNPERRGLSFSRYDETYKKNRKVILSIMKEFGFGATDMTERLISEQVEIMIEEIRKHNGVAFDPKSIVIFRMASVIISILFGKQFLSQRNYHIDITENSNKFMENFDIDIDAVPLLRFLPYHRKKFQNLVTSQNALMKDLEEAIKFNKLNQSEDTLVKRYLEQMGPDYDHQEFLYVLRDLCIGSADTAGSAALWTLVELVNHPHVLDRVRKEIDEVIPKHRLPALEDKSRLPYTEATIWEMMRVHTLAPLLPFCTIKDTEVCGYFIPKDCIVMVNAHGSNMDPKLWKDPQNFRPERFLDSDNKIIGRELVIAFGMGKRSCLGEVISRPKLFLFLASIIQNFDILPPDGQDTVEVTDHGGLIVGPSTFRLRMIPRRKSN